MRLIDVEQRGMLPVLQKVVGGYVEVVSNATADFGSRRQHCRLAC